MISRLRKGFGHGGKHAFDVLLKWVDSESVRPFQAIVYFMFLVGGSYMLIFGGEPTAVYQAMGPIMHVSWILLLVLGPLVCLIGVIHKDKYVGFWFQLGANVSIIFCLAAFTLALLQMYYLTAAIFTLCTCIALILCVGILAFRDIRRILLTREVADELERARA